MSDDLHLFDADAHAAALVRPAFTAGGRTYTGALLSVEQVMALGRNRDSARASHQGARAFMRASVLAWFPAPWWMRWLGLTRWHRPWRAFLRLPDATKAAALESFFLVQQLAAPTLTARPLVDRKEAAAGPTT